MDIDWKQVKEFVVSVGNRTHRAVLEEVGPRDELYLRVVDRDHPFQKAATGGPGSVSFAYQGQKYCFRGKVCAHSEGQIMVLREAGIIINHRSELRLSVPPFPATLIEKALFRTRSIEGFVYDICKNGVKVATEIILETGKYYRFSTSLAVRRSYRDFAALCSVRYSLPERTRFFSGLKFEQMETESARTLDKFLNEVRAETGLV
ncbi:MAG: hypothetical protein NC911_10265 [Candidatus Omnitrophica bacterium]|nr:hypothetical protein [Candidatus Omnitrophota bacterium]